MNGLRILCSIVKRAFLDLNVTQLANFSKNGSVHIRYLQKTLFGNIIHFSIFFHLYLYFTTLDAYYLIFPVLNYSTRIPTENR
jgi:hypothetical protein